MKKKTQSMLRTITAGILTVAVAAATITENDQALFARETFSGLQTIIENNKQLTIVEVVDDLDEASFGYLVDGMEPFDEDEAKENGEMDDLLDDLRSKGLLTTGNTDDWNSYPLRYEVTDTAYSDYTDDKELQDAGFRQQGDDYAAVRGYYELITEEQLERDPIAFYRVPKASYSNIQTMSPEKLQKLAEELLKSYAPECQDAEHPDGYVDGYNASEDNDEYFYFQFIAGEPDNAVTVLSLSAEGASAGNGVIIGGTTLAPSQGSAANGGQTKNPDESTENSGKSEDPDGAVTDEEQTEDQEKTETDDGQTEEADEEDTTSEENTAVLSVMSEEDASEDVETSSASAVIYVELDENNSVLVASLGTVGLGSVSNNAGSSDNGGESGSENAGGNVPTSAVVGLNVTSDSESSSDTGSSSDSTPTPGSTPTPENTPTPESTPAPENTPAQGTEDETASPAPTDTETPESGDERAENGEETGDGTEGEENGDNTGDDETETNPEEGQDDEYTISYSWKKSVPACTDGQYLKDEDGNEHHLADPDEWTTTVLVDDLPYEVNPDYGKGMELYLYSYGTDDAEDALLGTYTFSGWHMAGSDEILTEISELTEDVELEGEWEYEPEDIDTSCKVTFEWVLKEAEAGSLPDGVKGMRDIVLVPLVQTFDADSEPMEITCPDDINGKVIGDVYTVNDDFEEGYSCAAYDRQQNLIGTCEFQGWRLKDTDEALTDEEIILEGDLEIVGIWLFSARAETKVAIRYSWKVVGPDVVDEKHVYVDDFPSGTEEDGRRKLDNRTVLPDGVVLENGGWLDPLPELPDRTDDHDHTAGTPYDLDTSYKKGTEIDVYEGDVLVGTYTFSGWNGIQIDNDEVDWDDTILKDGFVDPDGNVLGQEFTISGTWTYTPVYAAGTIVGTGNAYVYVRDGIHNNNWFYYYVLGLEEKDTGKCSIQIVTYTVDGSQKRMAGHGPIGPDCSLNEALSKADLIYLNTNGVRLDHEGNTVSSNRRFSTENAKKLLERACNLNRSARPAVILDNSVRNNQVDENIQKVTAILCQEDIADAYASLSEDGMSYEKAFSSNEWQRLNALAVIRNGGNFVHDNVYCVSHSRGEFNNSTYPSGESVVRPGYMPALANADFENRFTNNVTDAGFAEVYQAIQKENYERARNGGQASLDEYVMPATAVAYILNYRDYDPIIYKDQIRVLEIQPCRDYTYYYDGQTGTTEFELKKKFAQDWAWDFIARLDADPNAITIDGMTTSEFCGKILDIYEEYDVIYFGSNSGILNRRSEPAGFRWVKVDAYDGTIGADNPYRPYSWDQNIGYSYHDGVWREVRKTPRTVWNPFDPGRDIEGYFYGGNYKWVNSEKRWYLFQNGHWEPHDIPDRINPTWLGGSSQWKYEKTDGRWYEEQTVYDDIEGNVVDGPRGGGFKHWFNNSSPETSNWMWKTTEWGESISTGDLVQEVPSYGWYKKEYVEAVDYVSYNDSAMNGMLYTHVGDRNGFWSMGLLGADEWRYEFRSSGNDILRTQVEELNDYLKGGSLIILASDFITTDQNGKQVINSSDISHAVGEYSYYGILDTSSYVYQFVAGAFEKDADGNDVPKYSNLIVKDYGNGELEDDAAFVEALNQQKVTLNLYSAPEAYEYNEVGTIGTIGERTLLQKEADGRYYLNYEFIIGNLSAVAPLTTRYDVKLFLDSNNDGIYNMATEELSDVAVINAQTGQILERSGGAYQLQANVPYRVRRELPDGYVGCIGWKLMVTQNGNTHIHDSVTGLTAVPVQPGFSDEVDPVTGKKVIHVLEIVPDPHVDGTYYPIVPFEYILDGTEDSSFNATLSDNPNDDNEAKRDIRQWKELLENIPDFVIDFDTIRHTDFGWSWSRGYNGGVDGVLSGGTDTPYGSDPVTGRRNDYLNLYEYDMIVLGFSDCYPCIPSQEAVDAILRYAGTGKSVLFTHDTTYWGWNEGDPDNFDFEYVRGLSLTMSIRELCGMDRYGVSVDWYATDADGKKTSNQGGSPLRTPYSAVMSGEKLNEVRAWNAAHDGNNTRDIAYAPGTNQTAMAAQTQAIIRTTDGYQNLFNYASRGVQDINYSPYAEDFAGQTCEASQVNGGIITQYPYDIPEQIPIAYTHSQYYQLDLETDRDGDGLGDVVCWYTINSRNAGDWNDVYDFSPNDVRNNYYIYNKGNITYSGVGHTSSRLTIEEKKLFINTFIAAYNAGIRNPSVRIVEDGSVNAPDLESVSIPFNAVDEATAGTYRVYYQVKDNNITEGTRNLSVKYYIGNPSGSDSVTYRKSTGSETIPADLFADEELITYSADTGLPVAYNAVRSGQSYYVDVPLRNLVGEEKIDFYVEVDLTMADDPGRVAAFDVDKLTIAKIKMFSLD